MAEDEIDAGEQHPTQHQFVVPPEAGLFSRRKTISGARQNPDAQNDGEDRAADEGCGNQQSLRMDVHDVLAGSTDDSSRWPVKAATVPSLACLFTCNDTV